MTKQVELIETDDIGGLQDKINEFILNNKMFEIIDIKYNHVMTFYEKYSETPFMVYTTMIIYEDHKEYSDSVPKGSDDEEDNIHITTDRERYNL